MRTTLVFSQKAERFLMQPTDGAAQREGHPGQTLPAAVRVLFMGTPDFALPSLRALVEQRAPGQLWPAGLDIVGVITRPDKMAGRGRRLIYSPVKQYAILQGLPVYQPGPLRRPEAGKLINSLAPDLIVVAAFGQILPPEILRLPIHGCLNVHASLLPRYRGAAPISAAILAGDHETGVTIMLMDQGLDTGPLLGKKAIPIGSEDTAGSLFERLGHLGSETLVQVLPRWLAGEILPEPQDPTQATLTHVLSKEDGLIDWSHQAKLLERAVRAYYPWPGAYTTWHGQTVKVVRAHVLENSDEDQLQRRQPGQCFLPGEGSRQRTLCCACGQGALALDVIQLAGKRALSSGDVLRGNTDLATALFGS